MKPDLPNIDPVMGDKGGLYVETGLVELFQMLRRSWLLGTPNAFEAETLAGRPVSGLEDLRSQLQAIGFSAGLVTSAEAMAPDISGRGVFCFDAAETTLVEHRGVAFEREPNGVGDFIAALSTGLYAPGQGLPQRTAGVARRWSGCWNARRRWVWVNWRWCKRRPTGRLRWIRPMRPLAQSPA